MSEFIVSARKYRPSEFQSVIGQEAITQTLKNAITGHHLAHAYLFCGPRGVGKTTCARIFAKAINCYELTPVNEPCGKCESCEAFNDNRSYNIHELDAASNNSVDDIRSLIEKVRIPPQIGKYSVYIIDEVHMLSQSAFNTFLKTLEEPPKHAVFILATTEKHKIIPTILSRCQIYDFKRISVKDAFAHLEYVANNEGVTFEPAALNVIAQKADGAMRDALSIFDQIVSFTGDSITYQGVLENLNVLDYEYYFRLTDYFLEGDVSKALLIFDEILQKGFDAHYFITGLTAHFRELMMCKYPNTESLIDAGQDVAKRYSGQAAKCPAGFLLNALEMGNQCDLDYRQSQNKRLLIELALLKIAGLNAEKKKHSQIAAGPEPVAEIHEKKTEPQVEPKRPAPEKQETKPQPKQEINPNESAKINEPKVHIHRTGKSKSVSIKGLKNRFNNGAVDETENQKSNEELRETFTVSEIHEKWKAYAEGIKSEDIRKYRVLMNHMPELKDNSLIIEAENQIQCNIIVEQKPMISGYLKSELKIKELEWVIKLKKKKQDDKRFLTTKEKYQMLAKKNSLLDEFKESFGLDIY